MFSRESQSQGRFGSVQFSRLAASTDRRLVTRQTGKQLSVDRENQAAYSILFTGAIFPAEEQNAFDICIFAIPSRFLTCCIVSLRNISAARSTSGNCQCLHQQPKNSELFGNRRGSFNKYNSQNLSFATPVAVLTAIPFVLSTVNLLFGAKITMNYVTETFPLVSCPVNNCWVYQGQKMLINKELCQAILLYSSALSNHSIVTAHAWFPSFFPSPLTTTDLQRYTH